MGILQFLFFFPLFCCVFHTAMCCALWLFLGWAVSRKSQIDKYLYKDFMCSFNRITSHTAVRQQDLICKCLSMWFDVLLRNGNCASCFSTAVLWACRDKCVLYAELFLSSTVPCTRPTAFMFVFSCWRMESWMCLSLGKYLLCTNEVLLFAMHSSEYLTWSLYKSRRESTFYLIVMFIFLRLF